MRGEYRIAQQNIVIESLFGEIHRICAPYAAGLSMGAGEGSGEDGCCSAAEDAIRIQVSPEDIRAEEVQAARERALEGLPARTWTDDYLETLAVLRRLSEAMAARDTILFHGSALAYEGSGVIFTAASGTGKSTHARLWRQAFGPRVTMINDDKPFVRVSPVGAPEKARVFGSPWDGKHHLSANTSAPLRAICVIGRAAENVIVPVSFREAYPLLLQQTHRPADPAALARVLTTLDRLGGAVTFWRLGCNMDPDAAVTALEGMRGALFTRGAQEETGQA